MQNSKKGLLPFRHGVPLSNNQRPKTQEDVDMMRQVPYASAMGSLMYAMLCTRLDICYSVGMVSRYQSNPELKHWQAIKHILKYLRRIRDYMLFYRCENLIPIGQLRFSIRSRFQKVYIKLCFHLGRWSHNMEECQEILHCGLHHGSRICCCL